MKENILNKFLELYGNQQEVPSLYFAPGRVNLIGEHIDYNGGYVFPCALSIGTYAAVRKRTDRKLRFYSMNFAKLGIIESSLDDLKPYKEAGWTNYPKGVLWTFEQKGYPIESGLDIVICGNIPNGSGLSSSASLEVLTGYFLKELFRLDLTFQELAVLGQYAENNFNGVKCGIMDQFAIAMGKDSRAIFLNTADLSFQYIPLNMEGYKIVIANSNKKRGLSDSVYNERREECENALKELKRVKNINELCELSIEEFETHKTLIKSSVRQKRAKHAVYENHRTIQAVSALESNDLISFGKLMNESHTSLKNDYQVTGLELDTLVEEAWKIQGVIGSRMTGAGFGGCTVSIVTNECVNTFIYEVGNAYKKKVGYKADFFVVDAGGGPRSL